MNLAFGLRVFRLGIVVLALLVAGCTYGYQEANWFGFGGYTEKQVMPGEWNLTYTANDYATEDTMETYWFYRAATLTIEQGYEGFSIGRGFPYITGAADTPGVQIAAVTYVPIFIPAAPQKPWRKEVGLIKMLHKPFASVEGRRVFDANMLKAALKPVVFGPKCDGNNVCAHDRSYLLEH